MPQLVGEGFSKPPPKFDFDAMGVTDGRVYFFRKGDDYDSSEANFRLHLARYAEDHPGVRYESRAVKHPDGRVDGMEVRFVRDQGASETAPASIGQPDAAEIEPAGPSSAGGDPDPDHTRTEIPAAAPPDAQPAAAVGHERHGVLGRIRHRD
jgi:hypothetical protein